MSMTNSRLGVATTLLIIAGFGFTASGTAAGDVQEQQNDLAPGEPARCECEATKTPPSDTAKAELLALLHYFLANSSKEEAHQKFWSDDLVYTSSNGTRFGKADIMAGFAADSAEADAEEPAAVYSGTDVQIQVFGTTAVVTFRLVGTPADGSAVDEYFNTGTFVVQQGSWRAVAWQATIIPGGPS